MDDSNGSTNVPIALRNQAREWSRLLREGKAFFGGPVAINIPIRWTMGRLQTQWTEKALDRRRLFAYNVKQTKGWLTNVAFQVVQTLMFKLKSIQFTRTCFQPGTCITAFGKRIGLPFIILLGSVVMSCGQVFPVQAGDAPATNSFTPVSNFGNLVIDYNFYSVPDTMDIYYNGLNIFSSGPVSGSGEFVIPYEPGPSSDFTIVIDQAGVLSPTTLWSYQLTAVVPEPSSAWLIGLGLPVFAFCRWKKSAVSK